MLVSPPLERKLASMAKKHNDKQLCEDKFNKNNNKVQVPVF